MIRMIALHLKRFGIFSLIWLVLTSGDTAAVFPGALAALGATWLAHRLARVGNRPLRLLPLLGLFPSFLWRSLDGGIDVALRALDPRLPLQPGWIRYRTVLPQGLARVALGSELSLMPGTLSAGCDGDDMLIHCLDVRDDVMTAIIAGEKRLLVIAGDAVRAGSVQSAPDG